jgi:riboflavin synthase
MFTGIVEELGTVVAIEPLTDAIRLTVRATTTMEGVQLGDSIAVNGCCLTVASTDGVDGAGAWTADVMAETLAKTTLGDLAPGELVNLERAVTLDKRLGGHIVQGHVDGVGTIVSRTPSEHWELVEIALPDGLSRYLVEKGSVTVDGVSLTVVATGSATGPHSNDTFTVSLIPETLARTTLGFRRPGDHVDLEVDVLAKYVERLLAGRLPDPASKESTHE